jgi:hypothetical protein
MKNIKSAFGFIVYTVLWLLLLFWFWIGLPSDGAMVYSLISFYFVLPITSFVISCGLGSKSAWIKWGSPIFFGFMAMMLGFLTFDLANTLAFRNWHVPDVKVALISAVPSLVGLCISFGLTVFRNKKS